MTSRINGNLPRGASFGPRQLLFGTLALLSILAGCSRRPKSEQQVVDLYIQSDGDLIAYKPDVLTCPTGALVRLTFHHAGRFVSARHDWMLTYPDKLDALSNQLLDTDGVFSKDDPRIIAFTPLADKGATVTTQFVAPKPGDYPFLCSTHPEDMRGILHVTK
jgi:plastocyanin